ncbi:hypothetical protein BKA69DRAFT_1071695 [Paraphysoderma sedebokerense]|nr:hypothetical protein BKA69DRAFT_1071695 [Paraphysoderma sedebokerense]
MKIIANLSFFLVASFCILQHGVIGGPLQRRQAALPPAPIPSPPAPIPSPPRPIPSPPRSIPGPPLQIPSPPRSLP